MVAKLGSGVLVAVLAWTGAASAAEKYPDRPVRVVVPFPPGSASDFLARVAGTRLSEMNGQQYVTDNRPGAGGDRSQSPKARRRLYEG